MVGLYFINNNKSVDCFGLEAAQAATPIVMLSQLSLKDKDDKKVFSSVMLRSLFGKASENQTLGVHHGAPPWRTPWGPFR